MKKLIFVLLMCLLCIALLVACDSNDTPDTSNTPNDSNTATDKKEYTITWKSEDGTTLGTTKVKEGTVPSYDYTVTDTAEWDYTMNGWATTQEGDVAQITSASADATYYANVSKTKQQYTITFQTNGGTAISAVTLEYGQTLSAPATNPPKPITALPAGTPTPLCKLP